MGNCLKRLTSDDISLLRGGTESTRESSADPLGHPLYSEIIQPVFYPSPSVSRSASHVTKEEQDLQSLWITTWCSSDLRHRATRVTSGLQHKQQLQPQSLNGSQKFNETPFMNACDMDDMLFECKNNAIYVLNTNYAYEEFGRLNLFGVSTISNTSCDGHQHSARTTQSRRHQPNDCLYRSSSATLVNSNHHTTEVPHISVTERTSSTTATTTTPPTSTRTIPKLFHYSPNQHSDHLLQNHIPGSHHSLHALPYDTPHLQHHSRPSKFASGMTSAAGALAATAATTTSSSLSASSSLSKKTSSSNLKSAIIAKKTKFWQYLEEEKWKKSTSVGNLTTTNCERNSNGSNADGNSTGGGCMMKNNGGIINNNATNNSSSHNTNNNNNSSSNNNNGGRNRQAADGSSSNSGSSQKSSTELYKEAAELLGLSCTLCDNCRCLDCQSRYFECDDSDSYSELSFLGDYFETYENSLPNNILHCQQQFPANSNHVDCCSIHSDNSSICSASSNHSADSPRDLSFDDSISVTN